MYGRMKYWGVMAGMICSAASASLASEPLVQDFDGWKITIRPGVSSIPDPLPPAPRSNPSAVPAAAKGAIQLMSLRQDAAPAAPAPSPVPEQPTDESAIEGLPVIIPGQSQVFDPAPRVSAPEGSVDPRYLSQMYAEIYSSIPFIRAEYDANPSYLHDTAVEFLFGKMRPTVIHRGTTNVIHHYPDFGVPYVYGGPGYYGGPSYGAGYAYPRLNLVVPGTGLRIHRLN